MKNNLTKFIPLMLAFFAMGAVDMVGIASNYVKQDFALTDTVANLLPSMVFLWFLIFSVPTGYLMNKIGRQKTVLISLLVTALALVTPLIEYIPGIDYNFTIMLVSFALLGIGNTIMQVSLNPLISNIVSAQRFAGTLTFGQFVKAIASFAAPFIAAWAAVALGHWRWLFPVYAVMTLLAMFWLGGIKIKEEPYNTKSSFIDSFKLLGTPAILLFFTGIMCHVGIDVGINTTAPKILIERIAGMTLESGGLFGGAGIATSIYFLFRLIGCLSGTFILKQNNIIFFLISTAFMALSVVGFLFVESEVMLYVCLALVGFGNSNIFSMIFSRALQSMSEKSNEISGLMIMGIAGGALFPLLMGIGADIFGSQAGAIAIVAVLVVYLFCLAPKIKFSK
jgi:fucose permease